ncbi:hypothetical protein AAGW05_16860 [Arthrobacter sp. LAPM80]|uniref:hypothetical protein n=1 Tax=Arthrobacter sp. LAPM80 TaxID=3141788 RepID=UPI00398AE65C
MSLTLQLASFLATWTFASIELPLFRHQTQNYELLGIKRWFGETGGTGVGEGRTKTVLRMAMLSAAARSTLTSLFTCLVGLILTCVVVTAASPAPDQVSARIIGALAFSLIVVGGMVGLFIQLVRQSLLPIPVPADDTNLANRLLACVRRNRRPEYLTIYTTVILVANVVTIVAAFGV